MQRPRVFIDGDQGTTGLQIQQRLAARRDLEIVTLPGEQRKDRQHRAAAINGCDYAILCLPDAAAREVVATIDNQSVRVIDASAAQRIAPSPIGSTASLKWTLNRLPGLQGRSGSAIQAVTRRAQLACCGRCCRPVCWRSIFLQ